MTDQNSIKTGPNWILLGLLLLAGVVAVVFLLGPMGSGEDASEGEAGPATAAKDKKVEAYTLNVGKKKVSIPQNAEVVAFARMDQVLRSPILPMLELDRERIWSKLKIAPHVKTFLETSGLNVDQGKRFSFFATGLVNKNRGPQVVANWEGKFDAQKVNKSFRDALEAAETQVGAKKALVAGSIALNVEKTLLLGNRPLFDDALVGKGDFETIPQVKELLSHLGKQGAITVIARKASIPQVDVPMIPVQYIEWLALTMETMGPPKVRLAALVKDAKAAKELAEGVEGALGIASLGLSAKGGDVGPIVSLIDRAKIASKGRVMTLSIDMPLSKLLGLISSIRGLTR